MKMKPKLTKCTETKKHFKQKEANNNQNYAKN